MTVTTKLGSNGKRRMSVTSIKKRRSTSHKDGSNKTRKAVFRPADHKQRPIVLTSEDKLPKSTGKIDRPKRALLVPEVVIETLPLRLQSPWARVAAIEKRNEGQFYKCGRTGKVEPILVSTPSLDLQKGPAPSKSDQEELPGSTQDSKTIRLTQKQYERLMAKARRYSDRLRDSQSSSGHKLYVMTLRKYPASLPVSRATSSHPELPLPKLSRVRFAEFTSRLSPVIFRGDLAETEEFSFDTMMTVINKNSNGKDVFQEGEVRAALAELHEANCLMFSNDTIYKL